MDKKKDIDKLSNKILEGVRKASKKLVEQIATSDGELVVADNQGNPVSVPAKELLKRL